MSETINFLDGFRAVQPIKRLKRFGGYVMDFMGFSEETREKPTVDDLLLSDSDIPGEIGSVIALPRQGEFDFPEDAA